MLEDQLSALGANDFSQCDLMASMRSQSGAQIAEVQASNDEY
jgi:hypothetical protein